MRTRETGYDDYGLSDTQVKETLKYCRGPDFTEEDAEALFECAMEVYPGLAFDICFSIRYNVSYDRMDVAKYMYATKDSFYGYRRKVISMFHNKKQ